MKKLLPDSYRSPWILLISHLLPKALLAMVLVRAWLLVGGESDDKVRATYLAVAAMEGLLAAAVAVTGIVLKRRARLAGWKTGLFFLAANIAVLWADVTLVERMVPDSVAGWMLSPGHLLFGFFCLAAPALFYCCVCVAGVSLPVSTAVDIGSSFGALCLVPAAWYIMVVVAGSLSLLDDFPFHVGLAFFIVSTALVLFAFLRLLLWLYRVTGGGVLAVLLAGLVFPIAGLALNIAIPFPANLQYVSVYVLTILNGVALLVPFGRTRRMQTTGWFLRCATYPFTVYFFLVFLPFLPLSIIAMIAAGAGFLILAPTFLFVIHTRRLFDEARRLSAQWSTRAVVLLCLLGVSLLPVGYTARAMWHRAALMQAVDAVYSSDYATDAPGVRPTVVRATLTRLQAMKRGLYLPFLSEYYNTLVFDGMVLPDHKITQISRLVCGEDLVEPEERGWRRGRVQPFAFLTGANVRRRSWANARRVPDSVRLENATLGSVSTNGVLLEARIELEMKAGSEGGAEFKTDIDLSPGMAVSGYALKVADEWVPGRIFDRKTAMWVYHMIRDMTSRDPGLLRYVDTNRLHLSVFPFAKEEVRHCSLTVLYPRGIAATLRIGAHAVALPGAAEDAPIIQAPLDDGVALFVPAARAQALPSRRRPPCVHFLLDASADAVDAMPAYARRVDAWLKANPAVTNTAATAVNFASYPLVEPGASPARLREQMGSALQGVRPEGGYCPDLAVARDIYTQLATGPAPWSTVYVTVGSTNAIAHDSAAAVRPLLPDAVVVGETDRVPASAAVIEIGVGDRRTLLRADAGGWVFADGSGTADGLHVTGASEPVPVDVTLRPESRYADYAGLAWLHREALLAPARINALKPRILTVSRASGILAPETAYIVVENSAQWKTLERAQKQSLAADHALDFDEFETPEPAAWAMLALFLVFMLLRKSSQTGPDTRSGRRYSASHPRA